MKRSLAAIAVVLVACRRDPPPSTVSAPPREERSATVADAASPIDAASADSASRSDVVAAATDASTRDASAPSAVYTPYATSGGVEFMFSRAVFEEGPTSPGANAARTFETPSSRSGRAPAPRAVFAALQRTLWSQATYAMQGAFNALGDGRFVSVVQRADRGNRKSPVLLVVIASENAGEAQLEGVAEVPTYGVWHESSGNGCLLSVNGRELRDLDNDGELELSLAIRFCSQPTCPMGFNEYEYLAVVDLSPSPSVSVMVQRSMVPQSMSQGRRTLRSRWRDTNADGHADLVIEGEDCAWISPSEPQAQRSAAQLGCDTLGSPPAREDDMYSDGRWCCVRRSEVALYNAQSDAWHPARPGATQSEPSPCGPD